MGALLLMLARCCVADVVCVKLLARSVRRDSPVEKSSTGSAFVYNTPKPAMIDQIFERLNSPTFGGAWKAQCPDKLSAKFGHESNWMEGS